jgi:hypothetical protein
MAMTWDDAKGAVTEGAALWTDEQVKSLNGFQHCGVFHEFTCGTKEKHKKGDSDALVATTHGWVCPSCDYTQNWAHPFMLDGSWLEMARANPFYVPQPDV